MVPHLVLALMALYVVVPAIGGLAMCAWLLLRRAAFAYRRHIMLAVWYGVRLQAEWESQMRARREVAERQAFEEFKRDMAAAQVAQVSPPMPDLEHGDFCDVVDAPFNAIVQCQDGEIAWCRMVKMEQRASGVIRSQLVGPSMPINRGRLRVMGRGFVLPKH